MDELIFIFEIISILNFIASILNGIIVGIDE